MAEYIEREAAIAWFMPYVHEEKSIDADVVISDIKGMKAADVEPVRPGRWVQQPLNGTHIWRCSKCETIGSPQWNYCPKCGAKIDEEAQNER